MRTDLAVDPRAVRLGRTAADKADAIDQCGRLLMELGAVEPGYLTAMHEREHSLSTYVGEGVAIPHGTDAARALVKRTELAVIQFPQGVDWDGAPVVIAIGIAAGEEEHVGVLSAVARTLTDPRRAERLRDAPDVATVIDLLRPAESGEGREDGFP
ncbi:PTS sugar transporter subunit IIA [Allosalinactinospora lopnorensis]|uniref:PTS sugar transporter subunit IIA n=1 Tax=Allosalinactinospora lopnorensis TaxID=1352348 RepID=UPI000623C416|nr:PTS sugar transporter subunit IIA [Allosalinactinospora lopnorensis]